MKNFVLVDIRDDNKIKKYQNNRSFKQSIILPYYSERYVCFSSCKKYSFEELIKMFLEGDEDEQIGAISMIAESHPCELYRFVCN